MNPRESALPRPVAMRLAAAEYGRCAEMFRSLSPAQWAEWAERHGKDFELTLTGPAGGTWRAGANGPGWTLDAVDFCRAIARRPASTTVDDLLNTEVPY